MIGLAKKDQLRQTRKDTVINETSMRQEKALSSAVQNVIKGLSKEFPGIRLEHKTQWYLRDIVEDLKKTYPGIDFHYNFQTSAMRPDGGVIWLLAEDGRRHPVLISEKKNQGTNDLRELEGKRKQAKGNAIERLGKNVIGLRAAMLDESIFPFVCFGDGCDFADDSSILDRVVTIAMFGHLNKEYLHNSELFNRGSFFFRPEEWSEREMFDTCYSIAQRSVYYYFSKYGEDQFREPRFRGTPIQEVYDIASEERTGYKV